MYHIHIKLFLSDTYDMYEQLSFKIVWIDWILTEKLAFGWWHTDFGAIDDGCCEQDSDLSH